MLKTSHIWLLLEDIASDTDSSSVAIAKVIKAISETSLTEAFPVTDMSSMVEVGAFLLTSNIPQAIRALAINNLADDTLIFFSYGDGDAVTVKDFGRSLIETTSLSLSTIKRNAVFSSPLSSRTTFFLTTI